MAKKIKKKKRTKTAKEERQTRSETVEGGYGLGFDKTERVMIVDPVHSMFRQGKLVERQYNAARKFRDAFEYIPSIASGMNPDKTRGGSGIDRSPTVKKIEAAEILAEARRVLGQRDYLVIQLVVGECRPISMTTLMIYGEMPSKTAAKNCRDHIGRRLQDGLTTMADAWFGRQPARRIRSTPIDAFNRPTSLIKDGGLDRGELSKMRASAYVNNSTGEVMYATSAGVMTAKTQGRTSGV